MFRESQLVIVREVDGSAYDVGEVLSAPVALGEPPLATFYVIRTRRSGTRLVSDDRVFTTTVGRRKTT